MRTLQQYLKKEPRYFSKPTPKKYLKTAINIVNVDLDNVYMPGIDIGFSDSRLVRLRALGLDYLVLYVNSSSEEYRANVQEVLELITYEKIKDYSTNLAAELFPKDHLEYKLLGNVQKLVDKHDSDAKIHKASYQKSIERRNTQAILLENLKQNIEKIPYDFDPKTGKHLFEVRNTVCEDVNGVMPDFIFDRFVFSIDFSNFEVRAVDSSLKAYGMGGTGTMHPHDTGDGYLCFGTLGPDVDESLRAFDFDVLNILLIKFVSSYNSRDTAGRYGQNFAEKWQRQQEAKQSSQSPQEITG